MLLNGAIDRDLYGVEFKTDILGQSAAEIDTRGVLAFSVTNLGNVPVLLAGNISLGVAECNSRSFPNYGNLDYIKQTSLEWLINGVVNPDCRIEVVRVYLLKKEPLSHS